MNSESTAGPRKAAYYRKKGDYDTRCDKIRSLQDDNFISPSYDPDNFLDIVDDYCLPTQDVETPVTEEWLAHKDDRHLLETLLSSDSSDHTLCLQSNDLHDNDASYVQADTCESILFEPSTINSFHDDNDETDTYHDKIEPPPTSTNWTDHITMTMLDNCFCTNTPVPLPTLILHPAHDVNEMVPQIVQSLMMLLLFVIFNK